MFGYYLQNIKLDAYEILKKYWVDPYGLYVEISLIIIIMMHFAMF